MISMRISPVSFGTGRIVLAHPTVSLGEADRLMRDGVIAGWHDPQGGVLCRGHPPGRQKGIHHRRPRFRTRS